MSHKRITLWDLPTRVFHWSLVVLVVGSVISGKIGGSAIDWHGRIGLLILGLLAFRIIWGICGSSYARFAHFFPTPVALVAYLRGEWRGVGHNPLGALSVFGLLAVLALQISTGLAGNDDIAFRGPLFALIDKDLSDALSGLHKRLANLLIALVVLHVGAIIFYLRIKKENLVKPMITGWKDVDLGQHPAAQSATGGGIVAFALAVLIALAVVYGASGAWIPAPPPPTSAPATPNW